MTENTAPRVDPANAAQLDAWNGPQGELWVARAERIERGVADFRQQFLAAAAIAPNSDVLDIGCGSGQTTRDAARLATDGSVLGVDLSAPMLELARKLAAEDGLANVTFRQADAQVEPFPAQSFEVAISRHGSMFFGDPPAAFANIANALRPDGRLVLLTWQSLELNTWLTSFRTAFAAGREMPRPAMPFSLSEPDVVRELLITAGFQDVRLQDARGAMYFGRDVDDAFDFVVDQYGGMMNGLDEAARADALDALRATLTEHATADGVAYDSATWIIEAVRP